MCEYFVVGVVVLLLVVHGVLTVPAVRTEATGTVGSSSHGVPSPATIATASRVATSPSAAAGAVVRLLECGTESNFVR